jgi:UDP-glucose 4-epimerase
VFAAIAARWRSRQILDVILGLLSLSQSDADAKGQCQLLVKGYDVIVCDNLSHGRKKAVPSGAKLIVADTADRAALDRIFQEHHIDAVMHFAAFIEAGESMQVPEKYFRNNTVNSLTLLEAMLAHKVQRLVFSSTAALYGTPR